MSFRKILLASIGLVLSIGAVAAAQQTPSPTTANPNVGESGRVRPDGFRKRRPRLRQSELGPRKREALDQLSLSQEQREQRQSIVQRNLAATKAQREQLFQLRQRRLEGSFTDDDKVRAQSLRQEIRSTMQSMRGEMRNTLTVEQRSQMEAFREQRNQRREEFLNRRKELRSPRP